MATEDLKRGLTVRAGAWIDRLVGRDPLPPLVPVSEWAPLLTEEVSSAVLEEIFQTPPTQRELALCFQSGLLLWNDALEPSHTLSQSLPSSTGSYWHGIMHRREPDFGNSKYWFRMVGPHPAFSALNRATILILQEFGDGYSQTFKSHLEVRGWDPFDFVDRCQQAVEGREPPEVVDLLERIQEVEIENLLLWCLQNG